MNDDVLAEMRLADDAVLRATTEILLDRREHATGPDIDRYNRGLDLAAQVRDERRALAREVADAAVSTPVIVAADDNEPPLAVEAHKRPARGQDDAALTASLGGFRMDDLAFIDGEAVPLSDLAEALRSTPELVRAEAEALGVLIGHNWQGRISVPARDAYTLLSGQARRDLQASGENRRLNELATQWVAERLRVTSAAFTRVHAIPTGDEAEFVGGSSVQDTPQRRERAQRAAEAAGAAFEAKCPTELRPRINMLFTKPSPLTAVRDRVAELMSRA